MATWEDGPEYAPIQRPQEFTVPQVPPLSVAPTIMHPAAGAPDARPLFTRPTDPVAPLESLNPVDTDPRDPAVPFDVVSSAATSTDSAWGAAHWSRPDGGWGPPATVPAQAPYDPTAPMVQHHPPPPPSGFPAVSGAPAPWSPPQSYGEQPASYPAPGSTEWYAPPSGRPHGQGIPGQVEPKDVFRAVTPGVLTTLAIGGLIWAVAPVTLAVAFALASARIEVAKASVRKVFLVALGVLAFFALVGALTSGDSFGDWWGFVGLWALFISWVVAGVLIAVVYRGLKDPGRPSGGYQRPWG